MVFTFIKGCKQYQIPGKATFLMQIHKTEWKVSYRCPYLSNIQVSLLVYPYHLFDLEALIERDESKKIKVNNQINLNLGSNKYFIQKYIIQDYTIRCYLKFG